VAEAWAPGGQAGTSTRIENYLGFPSGISGTELTRKATLQAQRFDAVLSSFHRAIELVDGPEGMVRVDLDDGQHVVARTLLVATGAQRRTLDAEGIDRFTGAGVYHVATDISARRCEGEDVIVVGGGNSAGQAAVHLSRQARSVRMVVRRDSLAPTMSRYLLNRIECAANVEILPNTEIAAVHGNGKLEAVSLRDSDNGRVQRIPTPAVFDAGSRRGGLRAVRLGRPGARLELRLARAVPARDRPARRLRRRRRSLVVDQAGGGSSRRRRARRPLRPPGSRRLAGLQE
jgi:thioredoxin reductase (NADPH)